jgi:LmbE family N-acetylglucosaminyl deacetylase
MAVVSEAELGAYDGLYLSPHLDDAALSCVARLSAERRRAKRSLVATLFSDGASAYALRRAEDEKAMARLGADALHCGFVDAPYRSSHYRSFAGITLDLDPADRGLVDRLAERIAELVRRTGAARVHAPLAVGGHVDHRLVHEAAVRAVEPGRLWFYEDRPYALVRGMVELRLRDLGERQRGLGKRGSLRLAVDFARAGYVRSYAHAADAVRALPHLVGKALTPAAPASKWKVEMVIESPDLFVEAGQVVDCYATQWPELFGTLARFEAQSRDYSQRISPIPGYVERLWHRL